MSGVGPLGGPIAPDPLRPINRDGGGGGGGSYTPDRQHQGDHHPHDEADISEEGRHKLAAHGGSSKPDARLEILSEIQSFNEHHERSGSRLKAILKPGPQGTSVLYVDDPVNEVSLTPFGIRDIYHATPQEVRARLQTFDKSRGSILDTKG